MRNRNNTPGRPIARKAEQFTNMPTVKEPIGLMDFLITQGNISRNKAKALLSHRTVVVDKKITTQYDFELRPGMTVQISKSHNKKEFKSQLIKLVYEVKRIEINKCDNYVKAVVVNWRSFPTGDITPIVMYKVDGEEKIWELSTFWILRSPI